MENDFSSSWVASIQPRKQRKYRYNAPLHIKAKFMHANLSKELRKKYGKRSIQVRKNDKVKVMRGSFKKHVGKVEKVNLNNEYVLVEKVEVMKKDGSKAMVKLHPSNLQIIEFETSDKRRFKNIKKKENTK